MSIFSDLKRAGVTAQDIIDIVRSRAELNGGTGQRVQMFGLGITDTASGIAIAPPTPVQTSPDYWVKIVSTLTGNGAYKAIIGRRKTDEVLTASTISAESDFYIYDYLPSGQTFNCYFVNVAEENKSPHWLDTGGKYAGWYDRMVGSYPLILSHTFDTQECEEA